NLTDTDGNCVRGTETQPANLIVLQPIARPFHLDEPVAALGGPELHEVRQPAGVRADVGQYAGETDFQVLPRQTLQRQLQQCRGNDIPEYEGRLDAGLCCKITANRVSVGIAFELLETPCENFRAPVVKCRRMQVRGRCLELMEERSRYGRKNGIPTQESKQRVEQPILNEVNRRAGLRQRLPGSLFEARRSAGE